MQVQSSGSRSTEHSNWNENPCSTYQRKLAKHNTRLRWCRVRLSLAVIGVMNSSVGLKRMGQNVSSVWTFVPVREHMGGAVFCMVVCAQGLSTWGHCITGSFIYLSGVVLWSLLSRLDLQSLDCATPNALMKTSLCRQWEGNSHIGKAFSPMEWEFPGVGVHIRENLQPRENFHP